MDNSHVALVSLKLVADQFESYRCDRNMPLGVNVSSKSHTVSTSGADANIQLTSLTKILKCAKDNDVVTLKAADDADALGMVFESPSAFLIVSVWQGSADHLLPRRGGSSGRIRDETHGH